MFAEPGGGMHNDSVRIYLSDSIWLDNFGSPQVCIENLLSAWSLNNHLVLNYLYWSNFVLARQNSRYGRTLIASDYLLPDGVGLQLYISAILGRQLNNLNGTDFTPLLLRAAINDGVAYALYGSTDRVVSACAGTLSKTLPGAPYYWQHGYEPIYWDNIKPDSILLVGLGSPLQERWAQDNIEEIRRRRLMIITVGGFFDFCSGYVKRAPPFVRSAKCEWLWRLASHPGKHCRKYLRNFHLPGYIIKDRQQVSCLNSHT